MRKTVAQKSFLKKTINYPEIINAFIYCKTFLISYVTFHTLLAFYIELIEPIYEHAKDSKKNAPTFCTNLIIYIYQT